MHKWLLPLFFAIAIPGVALAQQSPQAPTAPSPPPGAPAPLPFNEEDDAEQQEAAAEAEAVQQTRQADPEQVVAPTPQPGRGGIPPQSEAPATPAPDAAPPAAADPPEAPIAAPPIDEEDEGEEDFEPVEDLDEGTSPIADLASEGGAGDEDFVALDDLEEEVLEPIFTESKVYPYLDWSGGFRFRHRLAQRFDLGTEGTSAILPPLESYAPANNPADPDAERLWSTDIRLRLEPTINITESLRLHLEADLLGNQVLGALPVNGLGPNPLRPDPSRHPASGAQFSAREREWTRNAVSINEAYGELRIPFAIARAGRMDNHWGLGMFFNDGDCRDCDWGDSIDRLELTTYLEQLYIALSVDFPTEGATTIHPASPLGQPWDAGQADEADQYTLRIAYEPRTAPQIEGQRVRVEDLHEPIWNAGALLSRRTQRGDLVNERAAGAVPEGAQSQALIYRGLSLYTADAFGRFLYVADSGFRMRVELEAMGVFGSIDNDSRSPVGQIGEEEETSEVNCFDEGQRADNTDVCNANSRSFAQFGAALETEFGVNESIGFGVNAGLATGGDAPNWGWSSEGFLAGYDLDFFRFDPDYHVDLILFRNVIGTVSNAYYLNPYVQASFLESDERSFRLDLDLILSRAFDVAGTPAGPGTSGWLGAEADAALRYFVGERFHAALMGGILFPFESLNARAGRPRLTNPSPGGGGGGDFARSENASTAWTLQFQLNWSF